MTNEEILANAPEGATHYIKNGNYEYWKLTYINGYQAFTHTTKNLINVMPDKLYNIRSLADIRRIAELEQDNGGFRLRIAKAKELACEYSYIDGAHHKNWLIQQMIEAICTKDELEELGFTDEDWLEECIAP